MNLAPHLAVDLERVLRRSAASSALICLIGSRSRAATQLTCPWRVQETERLLQDSHSAMLVTTLLTSSECPEELFIFPDESSDLTPSRTGSETVSGQLFTPPQVTLRALSSETSRVKSTGASRRLGSISKIAQDLEDLHLSPPISPFKQPSRLSSSALTEPPELRPVYSAEQRDVSRTESTLINQSARELVNQAVPDDLAILSIEPIFWCVADRCTEESSAARQVCARCVRVCEQCSQASMEEFEPI
jgi:hypothetical protein